MRSVSRREARKLQARRNRRIGAVVGPLAISLSSLLAAMAGCNGESGPPLVPVTGMVLLNGKPLTTGGSVSFRDETGLVQPTGEIGADGIYQLLHGGRVGAPPGSYRVVVFASEPEGKSGGGHGGLPRLIIHKKYTDPKTTPLRVDVRKDASPDAYDLTVTNR